MMNEHPEVPLQTSPTPAPRLGLAIASLVLGVLALALSLFLIGSIPGIVGLILGVAHLRRRAGPRAMARWGVGLSLAGIVAAVSFGAMYYHTYKKFSGMMSSPGSDLTEWEGALAPDITVKTLDGQTVALSELRGKRVVLDFWATWCGPCVKEIPHFVRLFNETPREQLIIVGLSSEDERTLKAFVQKQGVKYPIAATKGEDLPAPYNAIQSIPTTFFIDRNGVIQSVAVGYHEFAFIKEHALAEDFKGEPKPPPTNAMSELKSSGQPLTAHEAWTTKIAGASALTVGDWDGDGAAEILAATSEKRLHVLSTGGAEKTTVPLPDRFASIEVGRHKTNGARLLGYSNWGPKVHVMDAQGREVWSYPAASGVDGAHWGDLDGDGTDELIVGMNGGGGLHAVSSDGKKLWAVTDIGNVWNQAVVPATNDRPALVFATEAGGTVRVYDAKGKLQRTIRPGGKYCAQMMARIVNTSGAVQGIAIGDGKAIAFDEQGRVTWSTPSVKNHAGWRGATFAGGDLNGDGQCEWIFREASRDLVISTWRGEKLASLPGTARVEDFTVASAGNGSGRLVTLSASTLRAYSFGAEAKEQ